MNNLFSLAISAILVQNIILTKFLGICPFLGVSDKEKSALGMGISVLLVMVLSTITTYLMYRFILVPFNLTYMKTVVFILVIATFVSCLEIIIKKVNPNLFEKFGIYLVLITTNCAILGVSEIVVRENFNFIEALVYSIFVSIGYTLVIYIFANLRERLENSNIPKAFEGIPIALITAGIMALIFSRFGGLA
jgi:electron transport complex protein RnfA